MAYASPIEARSNRKISSLWLVVEILIGASALLVFWSFVTTHHGSDKIECALQLRHIGNGLLLYANNFKGNFPDNLSGVIEEEVQPAELVCPSSKDTPAPVDATTQATIANVDAGGHLSYIYLGKGRSNNLPAGFILVYEPLAHHSNAGMNVLFGDMHVEFLTTREATWMLSEINSGHNPPRPDPSTQPARRSSGGGYSSTP